MPPQDKSLHSRKLAQPVHNRSYTPMGDQRYQQLMSALGSAFAQADEGQERRQQAQERERQHQLWLAQRDAVIVEIRATMRQFALSIDDIA